jgi:PAS domain S-box-containing protein
MKLPHAIHLIRIDSPLRLTIGYALFGTAWILAGDWWISSLAAGHQLDWAVGLAKGLLFIGITAVLLYGLVTRMLARHRATAKALGESEQRLALVLEASEQGYYDHNVLTGEAVVNETYARMLGYDPETFREDFQSVCARLHPDDLEPVLARYRRHLGGDTGFYSAEYRMRTAAGGWRWILARGRVVERDAEGRPVRLVGTHTDISERKRVEAQVVDTLSFTKAVLHHTPLGVVVHGPGGNAEIANESMARMIGTDVPGVLRQNFRELESWRRSGMQEAADRALATGREVTHRATLESSSGRSFYAEARLVPFDYRGTRHLLTLLADETVQRRTLEKLHLLHAALEAAPSGWVVTDAEGRIEWVNPGFTAMTGYTAAEVSGQNPRLLRSGCHPAAFYEEMWRTLRRGDVWAGELRNRRKDGTLYDEHMTVTPVRNESGTTTHFVAIKHDVTERKHLEQQLTRTQRLESIGLLASGIAHDLNNVLTPILLSVELLRTKYPAVEAEKYIETVASAAQRGAGIVRQVLTFARGMDGGERTEVQPRYLLKDLSQLIEETFPRNIAIRFEMARDVNEVVGDLTQLHQVLLNLAVNARDAMPHGGQLTLSAHNSVVTAGAAVATQLAPGPYVVLAVADTGTGIPPEVLEHMFEPFYTTKPRGKGTGLGLSTVYGIVRSHGGHIDVKTRLGQGSTFEVWLPVAPARAAARETRQAPLSLDGEGRCVLVVDDEEAIRTVAQRILRKQGFNPILAVDGTDGLRAVLGNPKGYAVAIVDMMMPRMSGADLVRNLRLVAPDLPVIVSTGVMTGEGEAGCERELEQMGVRAFLPKPYDAERMRAALAKALEPVPVEGK